jgi:uncharacterized protein
MPVALSYPGVYVEEIPSGVRTITGVATSITAFLGRAIWGPVNQPSAISSFADFERQFGGLGIDYPMSYAVADFFRNGGSNAIIVRLFKPADAATGGVGQLAVDSLTLAAASSGSWSSGIAATVDTNGITPGIAKMFGLSPADLFNLSVTLTVNGNIVSRERFINLTVKPDKDVSSAAGRAQRLDRVLLQSSQLVRVPLNKDGTPNLPAKPPQPSPAAASTPAAGGAGASGGAAAGGAAGAGGGAGAPGAGGGAAGAGGGAAPPAGTDSQPLGDPEFIGSLQDKSGLNALDTADLFNLLCIPPDTRGGDVGPLVYQNAMSYCAKRRAMLIVDSPAAWNANPVTAASTAATGLGALGLEGVDARNAALFFPRIVAPDLLSQGQIDTFVPCGMVAGIMAATDAQRGVWKAPAGLDAALVGLSGLAVKLTNDENGRLNPLGINCLRNFPIYGNVVWGARTLRGADQVADEYKYIPVRRLALYIEESLFRGTQWVVFEPNDEPLWAQIRLNVGAFMHNLFVKGAFQGQTPASAYFVKCDKDTTTQNDIDLGIVNISVGFAPLKPAEFVVLQIQQIAGDIQT